MVALTADTITDDMIRELRHFYTHPTGEVGRDVESACNAAMSTLPKLRAEGRATCAQMLNVRPEILNARAKEAR